MNTVAGGPRIFEWSVEFSRKYTKLATLSFLLSLCSEEQNIFTKKLPTARIEPGASCDPL